MKVHVDGQECTALIKSDCSQTLVRKAECRFWKWKSAGVLTPNGRTLNCQGYGKIKVEVGQVPAVDIEALVVDKELLGFDLLLGINAIKELGGVYLHGIRQSMFRRLAQMCCHLYQRAELKRDIWSQ